MSNEFYKNAKKLDKCRNSIKPSKAQIALVLSFIDDEKYAKYFFYNLNNPNWIKPLYQFEYFSRIPEPIESEPNLFQIPLWPAGEYLLRYAKDNEEVVLDIIKNAFTENWRAQELLVDATSQISLNKALLATPFFEKWYDNRFSEMLPAKLIGLSQKFIDGGLYKGSLQILESLLTPTTNAKLKKKSYL